MRVGQGRLAAAAVAADEAHSTDTLAQRAATILQRAILTGELAPGSNLRVNKLMKTYGFGVTPLREALSRLISAGFVEASSQRGFRVVSISRADLEDITTTRILIEKEALRLSIERGDDEWESRIVAALYRLQKISQGPAVDLAEGSLQFDAIHKGFHHSLISACGSPRLMELADMLFDQTFRYRQIIRDQSVPYRVTHENHQLLADAVIARDFPKAADLLEEHLAVTIRIYEAVEAAAQSKAKRKVRKVKTKEVAAED